MLFSSRLPRLLLAVITAELAHAGSRPSHLPHHVVLNLRFVLIIIVITHNRISNKLVQCFLFMLGGESQSLHRCSRTSPQGPGVGFSDPKPWMQHYWYWQ